MGEKEKAAIKKSLDIIKEHFLPIKDGAPGSRYRSWEYCYSAFRSKKVSKNKLAKELALYLSSYGMLRNSFLLQRDYKAHLKAVDICVSEDYDKLRGLELRRANKEDIADLLFGEDHGLVNRLKTEAYAFNNDQADNDEGNSPILSDVLITKIMLGVFGCVPAFDTFFSLGYRLIHDKKTVKTAFYDLTGKISGIFTKWPVIVQRFSESKDAIRAIRL